MKKDNIETWEPDEFSPLFIEDIKGILQKLYNQFRAVKKRNEYLEEENARLKSDAYKEEELAKMKKTYESMKADYYRGFPITEEEDKKITEWEDKIIGGIDMKINAARFHYEFYPTGLGTVGYVINDFSGEKFKFRDID